MGTTTNDNRLRIARITGLAYLGIIAMGITAEFAVRGSLVVLDDAAATAANIAASPGLFGLGIAADVVMIVLDVVVGIGLYRLLRDVDRRLALAAMVLRFVQGAVLALNLANLVVALAAARAAVLPGGGTSPAEAARSLDAIERHALGYDTGLIAFGLSCVVLGVLLVKSKRVSTLLASGMAATGVVYLVGSFTALFAPGANAAIDPLYGLAFVVELAFAIRLLARGLESGDAGSDAAHQQNAADQHDEAGRMTAVVQDGYGPAERLHVGIAAVPVPTEDEVLVRVAASGVDRGVWHLMRGLPYPTRLAFGLRRPRNPVPGMDLAGVVERVGSGVTRFAEGDAVFGIGTGTWAEYAVAPQGKLAAAPLGVDPAAAAVLAVTGTTALQAVEDHGAVSPGDRVLVLGASGGVGTYAVQIATHLGAEVTGTASTAKVELVRSLGAAHVIDHTDEDPLGTTGAYDVIIDTGGNRSLGDLRGALAPRGTLVIVGGEGGGRLIGGMQRQLAAKLLSPLVAQKLTTFVAREDSAHLERLADLVESGAVRPVIDSTWPLSEVRAAVEHLESGSVAGKVVLEVRAQGAQAGSRLVSEAIQAR